VRSGKAPRSAFEIVAGFVLGLVIAIVVLRLLRVSLTVGELVPCVVAAARDAPYDDYPAVLGNLRAWHVDSHCAGGPRRPAASSHSPKRVSAKVPLWSSASRCRADADARSSRAADAWPRVRVFLGHASVKTTSVDLASGGTARRAAA
jgi:hypothetical protein